MKVIIIGGVAAGASTAARLRRLDEDARIIIIERGGEISYANCGLPYYVGDVIKKPEALLLQTPASLFNRFNIDVRIHSEVVSIDRESKTVLIKNLPGGDTYKESYDKLVLAPGARPAVPPIPGAELPCVLTLRTVPDTLKIRELVDQCKIKHVVVAGGGFIGVEMVENLIERDIKVTLVEAAGQILPPLDPEMAAIVQKKLASSGVDLHLNTPVLGIQEEDGQCKILLPEEKTLSCDLVIMAAGVRPESELAVKAGLEVNRRGGIITDDHMQTADDTIYAAGDAVEITDEVTGTRIMLPLAGPANKQGRIIANNIAGIEERFPGAIGSAAVKVFDLTAAFSGASEKTLKAAGMDYKKIYISPSNHASYYPNAVQMTMKLLFSPEGKVLGIQCVGAAGTEKSVDVVATVIKLGGTVYNLAELDLCYAPPYSSAKDPVNFAGYVASNVISGLGPMKYWHDLDTIDTDKTVLLDVRTVKEYQDGHLKGSINIPVDDLRQRISELPQNKEILVYCKVGIRGYIAQRILMQKGFKDVSNLSGGYRFLSVTGLIDRYKE